MSLTQLLKNDPYIIKLFNTIPDIRPLFDTLGYYKEPFPNYIRPASPRIKGSSPAYVGTAYDFWLRAFIQRSNNNLVEQNISTVIKHALKGMQQDGVLSKGDYKVLEISIHEIWDLRNQYIKGLDVKETDFLYDCLILANCEAYYRSNTIPNGGFLEVSPKDVNDLNQLTKASKEVDWLFKTKKAMLFNPTFGDFSRYVGGADADFVIGNTIIDIKTTNYFEYKQEYVQQLIGYYLLSKYDKTFPVTIDKLGIFFARFNKLLFFNISDLKKQFNLELFSKYFYQYIVYDNNGDIFEISDLELKKRLLLCKNELF